MGEYKTREPKMYRLIDEHDETWIRVTNDIDRVRFLVVKRLYERPDSSLVLFVRESDGQYQPMKLPEDKEVPTNQRCIRNGVRCGHRRPTNDGNYSSSLMCHYLLDTGHQRNCPAGDECIHYTDEKCRNMDNWSINGNPLNFESLSKVSPRPGARLRAIRRAHKDSQRKLGEILGVSQNTVAAWEAGRAEMPAKAVLKVCKKYNISSEWLLGLRNKFKEENINEKRNNQGQD